MQTKPILTKLTILLGLLALTIGAYALARLLPDFGADSAPGLPPLSRLRLPAQTQNGLTASVEAYYADASRLIFKIRVEGDGQPHALDNFSLTNSQNEELNTGYGSFSPADDPSVILLEMIPAYALTDERLDGQLSFSVMSSDSSKSSRFRFDLDLPVQPAQTYLFDSSGYAYITYANNEADYLHPIYVERAVISPSFTWFYLCYEKPYEADWMIGHDAILTINSRAVGITNYALLYDSFMGDGTKGGEPGWTPVGNFPRCVKAGFPLGSEVSYPTKLTLTIPTLEQSMPEVIPQKDLNRAYPKLRAQGIDMEWHIINGGAYPEWKKLPEGMTEQEAMRKFNEALGYTFPGPWIFEIQLEPRESSQPIFSTTYYGAATPIPLTEDASRIVELSGWIRSFDLSPDGKIIAIATSQGIVLYDLETNKHVRTLNEAENFFNVEWSSDGKSLAAGGLIMEDNEVGKMHLVAWDASTWDVIFEPALGNELMDALIGDIAWSPDGRYLATSNGFMGAFVYDTQTGETISHQDLFMGGNKDLSWSPDGLRLVGTGDEALSIRRWKVDTDEWVRLFNVRAGFPATVEWSPDGKRIASGHFGGAVCLWTAETNLCDGFIQAHQTDVYNLAWSPDGSQLATGGGVIRIWDSRTGRPITSFGEDPAFIYLRLAWLDPHTLISLERSNAEYEGKTVIRFWDVNTGSISLEFDGSCCLFEE